MNSAFSFDIDIDLTSILGPGQCANDMLLDSRWYEMAHPQSRRSQELQRKLDRALDDALRSLGKRSLNQNSLDRRSTKRVSLDLRHDVIGGLPLRIADISEDGLSCIGTPAAPVMEIEFTLPGTKIPIESRVEVVRYNDSKPNSEVGLRFVNLDAPYQEFLRDYIAQGDGNM